MKWIEIINNSGDMFWAKKKDFKQKYKKLGYKKKKGKLWKHIIQINNY